MLNDHADVCMYGCLYVGEYVAQPSIPAVVLFLFFFLLLHPPEGENVHSPLYV